MFNNDALKTSLLDLAAEFRRRDIPIILGGGYGLYLKQINLELSGAQTLLPVASLPEPRATKDLDIFLRPELVTKPDDWEFIKTTVASLDYVAIEGSEYLRFRRLLPGGRPVEVDFLIPDAGELDSDEVHIKGRRVRPRSVKGLHAFLADDAMGLENQVMPLPVFGQLSSGEPFETEIYVPEAYPFLRMKLCAFVDRKDDESRDLGRHHALDAYRIVGLMTPDEYDHARQLRATDAGSEAYQKASRCVRHYFSSPEAGGVLRLREHELWPEGGDVDEFMSLLAELFSEPTSQQD